MKRIISLMLTLALSAGCIPVMAAEDSAAVSAAGMPEGIEWEPEDLGESGVATPVPVANIEAEQKDEPAVPDIIQTEPKVYEEDIDTPFNIPEEEMNTNSIPGPEDLNLFAVTGDDKAIWQSIYKTIFGSDYLASYKRSDGIRITGNTNRLVIEETDLRLPGKNGLDVVIKRKYDNQDYNEAYNYYFTGPYHLVTAV